MTDNLLCCAPDKQTLQTGATVSRRDNKIDALPADTFVDLLDRRAEADKHFNLDRFFV